MRSTVLESLDDFRDHREAWEALRLECGAPIFSSYDLVRLWLEAYKEEVKPYIVLIEDGGELIGAAPMFTIHTRVMGLPIRTMSIVGDLEPTFGYNHYSVFAKQDDPETIRQMLRCVKKARWNKLFVSHMDQTNGTLRFLDGMHYMRGRQPSVLSPVMNHYYDFPPEGNINSNIGKSTRANIQTARNKLEKEGRLDFRKAGSVEDAERAMELYLSQHEERWDGKISQFGLHNNRKLLMESGKLAIKTGIGEICELLIDGEVAGQALNVFDNDMTVGLRLGMSNKFQKYSPGLLLITRIMEDSRERGLKTLDFGYGGDAVSYKMRMANRHCELCSGMVYRGTIGMISHLRTLPPVKVLENRLMIRERLEGYLSAQDITIRQA